MYNIELTLTKQVAPEDRKVLKSKWTIEQNLTLVDLTPPEVYEEMAKEFDDSFHEDTLEEPPLNR